LNRYAAKVDANQAEIVEAVRKIGVSVLLLHTVGKGCPDNLWGIDIDSEFSVNILVEIKTEKGKLTPDEEIFFDTWRGQVCIIRSVEEAVELVNQIRNKR